jgi:hypothetical protein
MPEIHHRVVIVLGRLRLQIIIALALCAVVASSCSLAAAATSGPVSAPMPTSPPPSAAKIRADVARAEHSSQLWATINICNTKAHPDTVGIRGQIPALGFAAAMTMQVRLQYYTTATGTFKPLAHSETPLSAGTAASGLRQEGVSFKVSPPAILNATVMFSWKIGNRLLGSTTRTTRANIKRVQQGDPAGFSAASCRIGR